LVLNLDICRGFFMPSLPNVLLALQNTQPPAGAIEKMYGLMLYGAMRNRRPQKVLELGTGSGYSTAWMLLGLEENEYGHLWTVDLVAADEPVWRKISLSEQSLTYFSNDPIDSLQNKLPDTFDFIFHDAGHSLQEVKRDLKWLLPRLALGGSLVIHDVHYSPAMGAYILDYFDSRPDEWTYERIEEGCGVGIATRIKQTETRTLCKDESNGSTTQKGTGSSPGKTAKTISPISQKSKGKGIGRSKKTRTFSSSRSSSKKGQEQKPSFREEVTA